MGSPKARCCRQAAPVGAPPARAPWLRAGGRTPARSYPPQSPTTGLPVDFVAQIWPRPGLERIGRPRVADAAVRQLVALGSRSLLGQHVLQPFFHQGPQWPTGALGQTLGPQQERVLDVQRRFHRYSVPIENNMGNPYS